MAERKWTKGPWGFDDVNQHMIVVKDSDPYYYVAEVDSCGLMSDEEEKAIRDLIISAPDLYEALEEANSVIRSLAVSYIMTLPDGDERGFFPLYDRMKHALARARGEA